MTVYNNKTEKLTDLQEEVQVMCNKVLDELRRGDHPEMTEKIQSELDWKFPTVSIVDLIRPLIIRTLKEDYGEPIINSLLNIVDIAFIARTEKTHRKVSVYLKEVEVSVTFSLASKHLPYIKFDEEWVMNWPITSVRDLESQMLATQNRVFNELALEELWKKFNALKDRLDDSQGISGLTGEVPHSAYTTQPSGIDLQSLLEEL